MKTLHTRSLKCFCVTSTLSWVGEDDVEEFSCLLEEEELSSTVRTRCANFSEQTDSLMFDGNGETCKKKIPDVSIEFLSFTNKKSPS